MFRDGIIEGFEPKFKSIAKDRDRYFDALYELSEKGLIETSDVIEYSGRGSLWISYQYIENGLLDFVEADLKSAVASRDFYGPLFENTKLVLARILELEESKRVLSLYKVAISHRMRAMKAESAIVRKFGKGTNAHGASRKWIKHYSPALNGIIEEYGELLKSTGTLDPDLDRAKSEIKQWVKLLD
jgi:hypothetical protein